MRVCKNIKRTFPLRLDFQTLTVLLCVLGKVIVRLTRTIRFQSFELTLIPSSHYVCVSLSPGFAVLILVIS